MKQKNVILMVVAVGCGLVAAFLTSQMSAKGQIEQVEVLVAAKDLPVGTMITREEVDKVVKIKKMPKDGLPPAYVTNREDLIDKRLSRPVRAEESFNPQDLSKGGAITLPEGYDMISMQVGVANAAAGFVGPGSRVNILATVRLNNKVYAFPLLVNMLVVAVDTQTTYTKDGTFPTLNTVSFAVKEKEALLLSLAKQRGCTLELLLRHPTKNTDADARYNIDEVIKLLSDENTKTEIKGSGEGPTETKPETKPEAKPSGPEPVPAAPTIAVIKVLVAKEDIAPNTLVTKDLIAAKFEVKELPKDFASDALTNFPEAHDKAFKTGVAKGQWVTWSMLGLQQPKPSPQESFVPGKPGETNPGKPDPTPAVVKKRTLDVAVHTTTGTKIHRYEEQESGQWKKVAELSPEQAAKDPPSSEKAPGAKKAD